MANAKVAVTLDSEVLGELDALVAQRRFRSRSQAIEAAIAEKLGRVHTRCDRVCYAARP